MKKIPCCCNKTSALLINPDEENKTTLKIIIVNDLRNVLRQPMIRDHLEAGD